MINQYALCFTACHKHVHIRAFAFSLRVRETKSDGLFESALIEKLQSELANNGRECSAQLNGKVVQLHKENEVKKKLGGKLRGSKQKAAHLADRQLLQELPAAFCRLCL